MTLLLPKSRPITARENLIPLVEPAYAVLDQRVSGAAVFPRNKYGLTALLRWCAALRWCAMAGVLPIVWTFTAPPATAQPHSPQPTRASQVGYQQPPAVRAYSPPVHISPGSATALPPNQHRPRATPGLEMVRGPHQQQETIGLQDRIAQSLAERSERRASAARQPTPVAAPPAARHSNQIGSGLARPAPREPHAAQSTQRELVHSPQYRVDAFDDLDLVASQPRRQASLNTVESSVVEYEVELPTMPTQRSARPPSGSSIRQSTAIQDDPNRQAPVRHAFVQDYPGNYSLDEEFEWVEEPAQRRYTSTQQDQQFKAAQPAARTPARPSSILRRQDEEVDPLEFRPQPSGRNQENQRDFDRMERDFDRQPEPAQNDRPRSLLEDDDDDNDDDRQRSKTSLLDRSCAEYRQELLTTRIRDIALDISPPGINRDQNAGSLSRRWTNRAGEIIATGTMIDLRRGYVILDNGQKIAFARLSEADLLAVSEHWNLPNSCLVAQAGSFDRNWHPQRFTWTASSLCHKPLYFENIQLERYGHSHGPIMQPIRSTAHFFVRLVTLPYHMAIHPANECEYPLGLYRPGDCAPWLIDPIPISLNGIRRQALATTGTAFIIP